MPLYQLQLHRTSLKSATNRPEKVKGLSARIAIRATTFECKIELLLYTTVDFQNFIVETTRIEFETLDQCQVQHRIRI